jgi:hypothetical protein
MEKHKGHSFWFGGEEEGKKKRHNTVKVDTSDQDRREKKKIGREKMERSRE